jgi:hypothetical protein
MGAVKEIGRAVDPTSSRGQSTLLSGGLSEVTGVGLSDLDPTYRKGLVGGKLLGGEASLEAEAAAKEGADLQAKAQMEALEAIKSSGAQATETLSPLTAQAMPAREQQAALLGLGGDSQAAYNAILESPQFKAQQEAANRQLERRASAYGNLISGSTLAGLNEQNQILAGQAIQNQLGQLERYAAPSITALGQTAGIQQGIGQSTAQALTGAAQAQAQGLSNAAAANAAYGQGLTNLLGVGLGAALCDVRLKEKIKFIGKVKGYNFYTFNYVGDEIERIGPMAQEVEMTNPDAIITIEGHKAVNMGAL